MPVGCTIGYYIDFELIFFLNKLQFFFFLSGTCDFEDGMCAWQNVPGDDFDWQRKQGSTSDFGTGPNVDHTKNTVEGKAKNI